MKLHFLQVYSEDILHVFGSILVLLSFLGLVREEGKP